MRVTSTARAALPVLAGLLAAHAQAQAGGKHGEAAPSDFLHVRLHAAFVDARAGGNGTIGVVRAGSDGCYHVVDFSSARGLQTFDAAGAFLADWPTKPCQPAAPSPNGIAHDPDDDTLWLVDNETPPVIVQMSRHTGVCLGGFAFQAPTENPVGITFDRRAGSLWVTSTAHVSEWGRDGVRRAGGFPFEPPEGNQILSGIAHDLGRDVFHVTQSDGDVVYTLDRAGKLLGTTSLARFGVRNTQGIDFDFERGQLVVVDNAQCKVFVFDVGRGPQPVVRRLPAPCSAGPGEGPRLDWFGELAPGRTTVVLAHRVQAAPAAAVLLLGAPRDELLRDPCVDPRAVVVPLRGPRRGTDRCHLRWPVEGSLLALELPCHASYAAASQGTSVTSDGLVLRLR